MIRTCVLLFVLAACAPAPQQPLRTDGHIIAARSLTARYSQSRFATWNIRATAAGTNCDVLLVETSIILEGSMVEAMHYGAGAYNVVEGGVQRFCRDRSFRGVAYKDASGRIWTYGGVTTAEAEALRRCR